MEMPGRIYLAHLPLTRQFPECSVGVLTRQSGQDPVMFVT